MKENWVIKTWDFLNGKKTVIGTTLYIVAKGLSFIPALAPVVPVLEYVCEAGFLIATGGLAHKAAKTETAKNIFKKLTTKK